MLFDQTLSISVLSLLYHHDSTPRDLFKAPHVGEIMQHRFFYEGLFHLA